MRPTRHIVFLGFLGLISLIGLIAAPTARASGLTKTPNNLGLVGYWSFEDGKLTKATDFSGNGNTGTLTNFALSGATSNWVTGKRGGALNFDGTDDYVDVTDSAVLRPANAVTLSAWIKTTQATPGRIVTKLKVAANTQAYAIGVNVGSSNKVEIRADMSDGNGKTAQSVTSVNDGNWHHIVGTIQNAVALKIYVDGSLENTTNIAGNVSYGSNLNLQIGRFDSTVSISDYFNGLIDDVRIYNRALSATEVAALYGQTSQSVIKNSGKGLVGYWNFEEGTGTTLTDKTGNRNNGTLTNSPTWTTGKFGGGLSFDGTDDYVNLTSTGLSPIVGRTYTIWFYPRAWGEITILGGDNGGAGNIVRVQNGRIGIYNAGTMVISVNGGAEETLSGDSTTAATVNTNQWNFVSFRQTVTTTWSNLYLGKANAQRYFNGILDDFRVYNRALSAQEVLNLYNSSGEGVGILNRAHRDLQTSGLSGYWSFDGPAMSGTTAYDSSANANNGTLVNGPTKVIGRLGQALNFDGTDDYVNITDSGSLDITTAVTISAWVKHTSDTFKQWEAIATKGDTAYRLHFCGGGAFCAVGATLNAFTFALNGPSGTNDLGSTIVPTKGEWYHVVGTYDGATQILYVNGVAVASQARSGAISTNNFDLRIGENAEQTGRQLTGVVDDVRVYFNKALTAAEVLQLYNQGK